MLRTFKGSTGADVTSSVGYGGEMRGRATAAAVGVTAALTLIVAMGWTWSHWEIPQTGGADDVDAWGSWLGRDFNHAYLVAGLASAAALRLATFESTTEFGAWVGLGASLVLLGASLYAASPERVIAARIAPVAALLPVLLAATALVRMCKRGTGVQATAAAAALRPR